MFLRLHPDASPDDVDRLEELADRHGAVATRFSPPYGDLVGVSGVGPELAPILADLPFVSATLELDETWPLVSRARYGASRPVFIGPAQTGGGVFSITAGPCAVESRDQILETGRIVAAAGATILRGGAYKPRTSPYEFQGLGPEGVALLGHARDVLRLPVLTEVVDASDIPAMYPWVDAWQVGARNMQNFALLKELARQDKTIVLKRGPSATLKEWLLAAEYLVQHGNENVILCERGIRTFETATRYTLDLATAVLAQQKTWLPVVVDPSHATGRPSLIPAMALAALAAGLDGVLVEVHPRPREALSDGAQALLPSEFAAMTRQLHALAPAVGVSIDARIGDGDPLAARH